MLLARRIKFGVSEVTCRIGHFLFLAKRTESCAIFPTQNDKWLTAYHLKHVFVCLLEEVSQSHL
jgi:hypothetical protein